MTYLVQAGKQTFIVSRKEAVYMASIKWNITEQEADSKISALEKLNSVASAQCLKIA